MLPLNAVRTKRDNSLRLAPNLELPLEAVTQTFAILAKRGAGKTNTATVMVEEMVAASLPVVAVDPVGVWWGLRGAADGKRKGLPVYILGGEHGDLPLAETAGQVVADFVIESRAPTVLDLSTMSKSAGRRFMTDFAERVYQRNRDALHLVLDEADAFVPQRIDRGGERLHGAINDLVRRGRARGIGVTLISQRPALVNKDVLTQIEVLIALRMTGPQDRDAIERWIEHHADAEQGKKVLASLASLDIGEAWVWSPGWLDLFKRVQIRPRWTFDSSATPKVGERVPRAIGVAEVDLEALRGKMAASVERSRAEDPRELRRRVETLEGELRKATGATKIERVEVPVLGEREFARVEKIVGDLGRSLEVAAAAVEQMRGALARVGAAPRATASPARTSEPSRAERFSSSPSPPPRPARIAADSNGQGVQLRKGERRMLETMVRHSPMRVTRAQLGTLSGFAPSGGTFGTYFGTLKRAGYIIERGDLVEITDAGLAAGGGAPTRPQSTEETIDVWRRALRAGERRMLDVLLEARPDALTRRELGERCGFEASGGTFGTYLGTLRRNGLADVSGDEVSASETLFLGAS